jgi:hypothetical protein
MMNPRILAGFPRLKTVLSKTYRSELEEELQKISGGVAILNLYSVFIDIAIRHPNSPYAALDIRNSSEKLKYHFALFVGFIYSFETNKSYERAKSIQRAFKCIFVDSNGLLDEIKISNVKSLLSDDLLRFISQYKSLCIDDKRIEYYSGWICESKEGKKLYFHAANILDKFGSDFTTSLHTTLAKFSRTLSTKTAFSAIYLITVMLNVIAEICDNEDEVLHALKAENSTNLMLKIYHILLARTLHNEYSIESFILEWAGHYTNYFTRCFIDGGLFDEPIIPFIRPEYRSPENSSHTISVGGKFSEDETGRVFSDIQLEIKDDEAINIIEKRIDNDIKHIQICCQKIVDEIVFRQKRNNEFIKTGGIKTLHQRNPPPMGLKVNLCNTVATYYHYGIGMLPSTVAITAWLDVETSRKSQLVKELNIPTVSNLLAFATLLVIEHPSITPAWLDKWELFDSKGRQVGFKKVGKQWVAVSNKSRRGPNLAQQFVYLNDYSKLLVDRLIEHTKVARDAMKQNGNTNWRKVMLYAHLGFTSSSQYLSSAFSSCENFQKHLIMDSFNESDQLVLTKSEAKKLSPLVTLRNVRKSRGLQVYLKTHSIKAVADVLGHKEVSLNTLRSYLPEPLMDFFNARWVRIFQNAIIFESMKDSPYLFDAIDISEENLAEFLNNHSLGELPSMLKKATGCIEVVDHQREIEQIDELVFTLSTPLFQVLIAIRTMVDKAADNDKFLPIIEQWYESAKFILSHFDFSDKARTYRSPPVESLMMYENAIHNPLDINNFKANLSCQ